jgi:hypothetical protein
VRDKCPVCLSKSQHPEFAMIDGIILGMANAPPDRWNSLAKVLCDDHLKACRDRIDAEIQRRLS